MTGWQCRRRRVALVDYAAGSLDDAVVATVERHLAACAACRETVAALRGLPAQLGEAALADPGEEFWLRQRQAIARAVRNAPEPRHGLGAWLGRQLGQPRLAWRLPLAAAASLFLALSVYRFGLVGNRVVHVAKLASSPSVSSLDDESLDELHDLVAVVAPRDEPIASGYQDEDLLASLPLSDLIGPSGGGASLFSADADSAAPDPADAAGDDFS